MKNYEFINHTADLGIKVRGKSLADLFANAGYALFDILLEIEKLEPKESIKIRIPGGEKEEIFVDWLRELLLKFNSERWAFKEFDVYKIDESGLEALVRGEKVNLSRHRLKTELKAVTYHEVKLQKKGTVWEAQVIFDI